MRSPELSFQNLAESIRLVVFGYVRSYILIDRRDARANIYIPNELSFFDYRRGYS